MPTITRLVQGKKNPNRVNMYLDGEFAFALSIDEVGKKSLKKGSELSESEIESLKKSDSDEYIYGKLLNFLSYRPRTIKEVRDRLFKYEVRNIAEQDHFIAKLTERGYLDDLKFAQWFIDSRIQHRPRSQAMLRQELLAKGVARDVIDSLLTSSSLDSAALTQLLSKKLKDHRVLTTPERQKIYAYLSRQGFAWDRIKEVVKTWETA